MRKLSREFVEIYMKAELKNLDLIKFVIESLWRFLSMGMVCEIV